jgi:chemotaxis protein histidine kinase CheA
MAIEKSQGFFKPCNIKTDEFLKQLEAAGSDITKMKAIEALNGDLVVLEPTSAGTKIHGLLAYPGFSMNGKLYGPAQLMKAHMLHLPIWLNHGTLIGTDGIGHDLLPQEYRQRLGNLEKIVVGEGKTWFDADTLQLRHEGIITDPFYKNPKILEQMSVSQGVLHPRDLPRHCDELACYQVIENSIYEEYSIVFKPGFSIATLSVEALDGNQSYIRALESPNNMEKSTNDKELTTSTEQADGTMPNANNPSTTKAIIEHETGTQIPVKTEPLPEESTETTDNGDPKKDEMTEEEKAKEAISDAEKIITAAKEASAKALEAKKAFEALGKTEKSGEGYNGPNKDIRQHEEAQAKYMKSLEQRDAQNAKLLQIAEKAMEAEKAKVEQKAKVGNTMNSLLHKSIEAANLGPKQWVDSLIKGAENVPWNKTWTISPEYIGNFVSLKFKQVDQFGQTDMKSYESVMGKSPEQHAKAIEATNVGMAGGADPNNFQRTQSELVLVYPDGIIVTPIQQFCETAILAPGKKEHLFYDVDIPDFAATDEANMDAGGSGYALAASDVTINASGGKTNPQGGLVRIGFTDLEELPIDIIQKVNIGFAMRAEERKNFQAVNTAYNTDTAYDPLTDAVRPIGGGEKHALDTVGNSHWIDGNDGTQIVAADGDAGATSATFAGLLAGKKIIEDTGLSVENVLMYTTTQARNDLIEDTAISSYVQRSKPEIITEGVVEKLSGVQLITTSSLATHPSTTTVSRSVMFVPTVSFGFVTGRELQVDAERVARQQSIFASASIKTGAFVKRVESTVRFSSTNA